MNATKTTFSQRLISALRDRGMSQSDLARAVGVIGRIGAGGF